MKHPIDTSQWGEFVVGELFDNVTRGTRLKKSDRKPGPTPLVTAGSENQGIAEHILENKELFNGVNLTIDMFGNVFARNYPFYADDNILVLQTNHHTLNQIQFMAGSLAHLANEYGYTNQFRQNTLNNTTIKLPLKSSADLENYTQDDINWNYMDTVMSRVTEKAKERLANLPQPTDKKKTPVDTNSWGEFVVGELFECDTTKTFYPNKSELPSGDTPYITRSTYDNGISGYYDDINNEFTIEGNCLTIGAEGGIAFWQPKPFVAGVKVYTVRHPQLNESTALFVASLLNTNSTNYNYTNARVLAKIQAETIKLPLKPSADPKNYTQEDIDWDYMDSFMQAVEEKAHERLVNLTHK